MTKITIPTNMPPEQIPAYVKNQIRGMEMRRMAKNSDAPIPEPKSKKIKVIPGDDWTTNTKGMSGKQLKRVIQMSKDYEYRRTKFPKK